MGHELRVEIVKADALSEAEITLWRSMVSANPQLVSPYFRPEFSQIAGRVSPKSAVAIFCRGDDIVGFFPHQKRGSTIQPMGAPMNDYHGVIGYPDAVPSLETVARLMKAPCLRASSWVGCSELGEERETLMVEMPDGFEAWYAERRTTWAKFFKDKERCRRSLIADFGEIRVERDLRDPQLLDRLIVLKRNQYARTGRHDIFDCGWTRDLLHGLMQPGGEDDFAGSMTAIWAGDELLAVEYSLHAGRHYHFWFPTYVPNKARCSPGILLTLDLMRMACDKGYRTFDFGFCGEGYKKYFCNANQMVSEAVVRQPSLTNGLKKAAVSMLNTAGQQRGTRLMTSVRRRWGAIEACETTQFDRIRGAVSAAGIALQKVSVRTTANDARARAI